jgi:4-phospho-D-threonate 3-dehydrogenase / 4-phospho-D-erythronate 3-dehydrogenase
MNQLPIILTMGDPAGIGPEVILQSFKKTEVNTLPVVVFGDFEVMELFKTKLNITEYALKQVLNIKDVVFNERILHVVDFNNIELSLYKMGEVSQMCGQAAFEYVVESIKAVQAGLARAVTTAPLNKEAMHLAGHYYPGHTEIFAEYSGSSDYAMMLYDEQLSVIHVSTHISLSQAISSLSQKRIEQVIELAGENIEKIKGRKAKIAVAGLNPHASENGLFGNEEEKILIPAIEAMKSKYDVIGPVSPDTVFVRGLKKDFDIVVAMYHDQGHIPFKLFAFDSGVNTSVGLPIIRTSVDHGTAFDIAGQGIAGDSSMVAAILLANKLSL